MKWDEIDRMSAKANTNRISKGTRDERPSAFGLCSRCAHFSWRKTKFMDEEQWCDIEEDRFRNLVPNRVDPIVECSSFIPAGQMSLYEMGQIAYLIDVEDKKREIGFGKQEIVRKVSIREPEENDDD